jgi:hypothetical protein
MQELSKAWNAAQSPDDKLAAVQQISYFLDEYLADPDYEPGTAKSPDSQAAHDGWEAGRHYQGPELDADGLQTAAYMDAKEEPEITQNPRLLNFFTQSWINGYKERVGPEAAPAATPAMEPGWSAINGAPQPAQSAPASPQYTMAWVHDPDGWTHLRKDASAKSPVMARLKNGEKVAVTDVQHGWAHVQTNSGTGWIYANRLRIDESLENEINSFLAESLA